MDGCLIGTGAVAAALTTVGCRPVQSLRREDVPILHSKLKKARVSIAV